MKITPVALALLACAVSLPAHAETPDAPIVFKRDADHCYRIPSVSWAEGKFVAIAESRSGFNGRRPSSDDGNVDLVMKTSSDGRNWSPSSVVLDNDALSASMSDPRSPNYDPAYAKIGKDDRYMRVGSQTLGFADGRLILLLSSRYNTKADCGNRFGCDNSPENLRKGAARERYIQINSDDFGKSWSSPKRIQSDIYKSCISTFFGNEANLKNALIPLFEDDSKISDALAARRDEIASAFDDTRHGQRDRLSDRNYQEIAEKIGIEERIIKENYSKLSMLFNRRTRPGPGNITIFPYRGGTRVFVPGAPLAFYSDDLGKSWTCSDTFAVQKGSERQAAWLGEGRMVMTLRQIGGKKSASAHRLFATSTDGGAKWSSDDPLSINGRALLPDAVAQGSMVGIPGSTPPSAVVSSIANQFGDGLTGSAAANDADAMDDSREARRERRRERRERRTKEDPRKNLALTRVFFDGGKLSPGFRAQCDAGGATTDTLTVWPGSAAYSAIIDVPERKAVAVLFEGSDDDGPAVARRAWNESIRFMEVPLDRLGGMPNAPVCR